MAGKYTFWRLLSEREIEIPVIQRDYAQGRKTATAIRSGFLLSIKDALINQKPLDMNFVYGSIEDKDQFVPIDGQQRLTTLFLLHLYLIHATGRDLSDYKQLENFKYKTRMTSTYFCDKIIRNKIGDSEGGEFKDINSLRDTIIDNPWFGTSWKNDPTVDAMLNMLEDIHKTFKQREDLEQLLDLLLDENKCPLHFYYLDLGEYHLEDSIYIKMNARGKALTDYENFKAKLEKFLDDKHVVNWEEMANSLDREWTEFFWGLVNDEEKAAGGDIKFDNKMMNFIVAYIYNEFAFYTTTTKRDPLRTQIDELFALSKVEFTNQFESFSKEFKDENTSHNIEDSFVKMFEAFSLMVKCIEENGIKKYVIKEYAPNNAFYNEQKIFKDVLEERGVNGLTIEQRVRFYAYTQYLLNNAGNITSEGVAEWLRVVEHLIAGQNFMGLDEYVHVVKGFHWLAENSADIVQFLSTVDLSQNSDSESEESNGGFPFFNKYIFGEECLKARLMVISEEWNQAVREAEANKYLNGQIFAIMEFAGITKEAEAPRTWSDEKQELYLEAFKKYSKIFCTLFVADGDKEGRPGLDKRIGNVFRRALLTKGDFSLRVKSNMSFLVNYSPRWDGTWKRLLRPQKGQEILDKRGYLKALFDDERFDINNIEKSCEEIISNYTCDNLEYKYFIEIPEVMSFVIGETDHNKVKQCWNFYRNYDQTKFLLWTTRLSGYNMDYYKYALLCVLQREKSSRLKYENKTGVDEVIREPIVICVAEDDIYKINLVRDTKQYRIIGGKNNIDVTKDTLEDMVQYIKDNKLLDESDTAVE